MTSLRRLLGIAATVGFVALLTGSSTAQQNSEVLTLSDKKASTRLRNMAAKGDLSTPGHAAAWVVISSVALGVGRDKCQLPEPGETSFLIKPALDGMQIEQIITLNRLVTANYRSSESGGKLNVNKLYPITRQAVKMLGYNNGRFDCGRVAEIWNNALSYAGNRGR